MNNVITFLKNKRKNYLTRQLDKLQKQRDDYATILNSTENFCCHSLNLSKTCSLGFLNPYFSVDDTAIFQPYVLHFQIERKIKSLKRKLEKLENV